MPVYNEENYIEEIVKRVTAQSNIDEVVIVNDGSTDSTRDKLGRLSNSKIRVINLEKNGGKGLAVREGLKYVKGDILIIQDADLEYNPGEYPALLEPFKDPRVEVVYGSRVRKQIGEYSYITFFFGGLLLTAITDILYLTFLTDEPTGYKVFKTEVLRNLSLESKGFEFCPEVTAKLLRKGIKIVEVPVSYSPRNFSQGKKIRPKDGFIAIWTLLKYRFIK